MSLYSQILITGGSGFLGWNLTRYAANRYDTYFTYYKHALKIPGCQEYHVNLQNSDEIEEVLEEIQPEVIIHTAALANADICEKRRSMAHDINVAGTRFLAECAEEVGARLIYISTDLVFDGMQGNYSETDLPRPSNYYAETKLLGEKIVKHTLSDYLIVRMALMYGNGNGENSCFTDWMRTSLEQQQQLHLYTDQYRTPLFVQDATQALIELVEHSATREIFHLGGKERLNRYEFGGKFAQQFNYDQKYLCPTVMQDDTEVTAKRGGDCSLNSAKIQNILDFELSDVQSGLYTMHCDGVRK